VSRRYAWYVLGLLTTINLVNYVDRMVIVSMYDDLRRIFHVSDGGIGILTGSFFAVHALTTYPFGWMADRWNRIWILAIAVFGWSLATLGTAYAATFAVLVLFRSMVGVGEAAYGPVSNALICEIYPRSKARAVGIFNGGMFAGACIGMAIGMLLGFPVAFEIVAIPGFVLGVLVLFLKVPKVRPGTEAPAGISFSQVRRDFFHVFRSRTMKWMLASGIFISFTAGASISWCVDFFMHTKDLPDKTIVPIFGAIALTGGVTGVIVGGYVADRLHKRFSWGRTGTMAYGFAMAIPFSLIAIYVDGGWYFLAGSWFQMFFLPWYNGPIAAVIDDVVDDRDANGAQAAFTFWIHLIGTSLGPPIVGYANGIVGRRTAMLLPVLTCAAAAFCALIAGRHVGADMEARRRRAEESASTSLAA
jgi:MFS transporter, Spinster family, sphingosine-1-phosphate transporter